jgi:drug/metabolite transporter (DMT)-like permease
MSEPVLAAVVAWVWLQQSLTTVQVLGGLVVLAGIALVQSARTGGPSPEPATAPYPAESVTVAQPDR